MPEAAGIQIHWSAGYDAVFGWIIRRSDLPILALAAVHPGNRVLDVATGPGYLALAAASIVGASGQAVGIDLSPEMVERAKGRARREGLAAEFLQASAQQLPFPDGSFDAVVSRLAVHHLPGEVKDEATAEMRRVLAPGGRVVIADLGSQGVNAFHHILGRMLGGPKVENAELRELLRRAGFQDVEAGALGVLDYAKAVKR